MADLNTGKLTQIIGAVLDIKSPEGKLPEIYDAINVPLKDGKKLVKLRICDKICELIWSLDAFI